MFVLGWSLDDVMYKFWVTYALFILIDAIYVGKKDINDQTLLQLAHSTCDLP